MKNIKVILIIFFFLIFIFKDISAFDIGKIKDISKITKLKKNIDTQAGQEGPVVALLPFSYTYDAGKKKAEIVFNETALSLISIRKFQVYSAKEWYNESFIKNKSEKKSTHINIDEIAEKAKKDFLPVDYICHGYVFKSGPGYGIRIDLYSLKDKISHYFFRTTDIFNNFNKITDQIAFEVNKRLEKNKSVLVNKKVFINDFKIILKNFEKDKKGAIQEVNVPGIIIDRVNYRETDDFFSDLLLYNLYISGIFNVKKSIIKNEKKYESKKNGNINSNTSADYLIEGIVDLSNTINTLYIKVLSSRRDKIYYEKCVELKTLKINYIYNIMRTFSKNILMCLLTFEERNKTGEVFIDAFYNNNDMFCNDHFLGRGVQKDLILPVSVNDVDIQFYKNWVKKSAVNIFPYNKNKLRESKIKYLIGLYYTARIMLHPLFDDNLEIPFSKNLNFTGDELFNNKRSDLNNKYHISSLNGMGLNFSVSSKYFDLSGIASFIFGECFRNFSLNNRLDIEINGEKVEGLTCNYFIDKYSLIFDLCILPSFIFPPSGTSFRFYAGSGFFASLSYNRFTERISGKAVIDSRKYDFDINYYNNDSLYLSLGISPEFGFIYNFYKFNLKAGFLYNFDLYKYLIFSDIRNSSFNTFYTGSFGVRIGVNYYLN
ncbi:MAG: hypothetical protein JXB50_05490 [Spirochaetes bacterium]|nr:hypothetical protein [Spirochaetota bacterium]